MSVPGYQSYRQSRVEWNPEVPAHWTDTRLRFVAKLNPSKSEIASRDRQEDVSFVPMDAVGDDGSVRLDQTRPIGEVETGYTYFANGDVTVAKITPCFENGKGAVMRGLQGGIGFGTTELIVARPSPDTSADFLHWLFTSSAFRKLGEGAMYGAGGQKRVADDFVRDFPVAMPPRSEQTAIAAFLDRETGKIDALVEAQRRLIELLKEKRQAVISHAVTKGLDPAVPTKDAGVEWLGAVPAHWEMRSIASCSSRITNGYVGPTRDILFEKGVRYLQSLHIKNGEIRFSPPYFVAPEWSRERAKSVLQVDDVLIVQTGAVGQTAVVTSEFAGCNCHALIIVRPLPEVLKGEFLELQLRSNFGQQSLATVQTGALHPHLNCGTVKLLRMPVPPIAEQRMIIAAVKAALLPLDDLIGEAEATIPLLIERRAALISAAVTGKIDVQGLASQRAEAA